ncbi:NUDIX domain-containing protein [Pontibacter ruber]|uniref:NUDIX domain-containing protein n=1 Tax=Pontibacter ruber TaxID=1343895 RepID=A0ABW5CQ93_9BACT|nr:NUDIX hydrolase [Pontibacter ruber]
MKNLNPNIAAYTDKVRVRVCGICIEQNKLLLVRHQASVGNSMFWAPPGGGLNYGETVEDCLKREFLEETGLQIQVNRFLFVNEFLQEPLHAIELFFEVSTTGGSLLTGIDPEATEENQIIEQVQFLSLKEIQQVPKQDQHCMLHHLLSLDDLLGMPHRFLS